MFIVHTAHHLRNTRGRRLRWRERARTTWDASFGPLVSFFYNLFVFLYTKQSFHMYTGYNLRYTGRGGWRWRKRAQTDARRVRLGPRWDFLFLFSYFSLLKLIFIVSTGYKLRTTRWGWWRRRKRAQTDASSVRLGPRWVFLVLFRVFRVFFDTNIHIYCIYRLYSTRFMKWTVATTKTGPNGRVRRRLGPK